MDRPAALARPAKSRLAQLAQGRIVLKGPLERAQLTVGLLRGRDLRLHQLRPLAAESPQLDDEAAQVSQLDLT